MIERTFDYRVVKEIAGKVPFISNKVIYLVSGKEMVWAFEEYLDGLMIHVSVVKSARGKKSIEASKMAFKWLQEKGVKNVYACISSNFKAVCRFAVATGMKFTHTQTRVNGNVEYADRYYKITLGD